MKTACDVAGKESREGEGEGEGERRSKLALGFNADFVKKAFGPFILNKLSRCSVR